MLTQITYTVLWTTPEYTTILNINPIILLYITSQLLLTVFSHDFVLFPNNSTHWLSREYSVPNRGTIVEYAVVLGLLFKQELCDDLFNIESTNYYVSMSLTSRNLVVADGYIQTTSVDYQSLEN